MTQTTSATIMLSLILIIAIGIFVTLWILFPPEPINLKEIFCINCTSPNASPINTQIESNTQQITITVLNAQNNS